MSKQASPFDGEYCFSQEAALDLAKTGFFPSVCAATASAVTGQRNEVGRGFVNGTHLFTLREQMRPLV